MNTMTAPGNGPKHAAIRSLLRVLLATLGVLLIPATAMLFTREVNWGPGDFLVAAVLLGGTGLLLEFTAKKCATRKRRVIAALALVTALLLVWAELAVGIVGSPFAGS